MLPNTQLAALQVLFQLARADRPATRRRVAAELRMRPDRAERLLAELERLGLVDAQRVRLTMNGLALAVALPAVVQVRVGEVSARCAAA